MSARLREIAENNDLIRAAHLAIENEACDMRDRGIGILGRANGITVLYKDGSPSPVIRIGTADAVRLALKAIAQQMDESGQP